MSTHSSVLAWRIPWTEEPGGLLQSMGHEELDMTERLILPLIRVLGEVEKINFIALPVTGGHSRLLPSKLCPNLEGLVSFIEMVQRGCDQLEDILLIGW